ncbi:ATP-dependent metallopeptidase FtsH/Yme1/Tma family protein [Zunongwangia sp.]|uniref:ATP-dependent metallopeptidase FtsH/Yme1/Tma family protein n=1 Tax=Zunongwangia sp. TaxID=1965325 RepID=UPI003AA7FF88
MKKFLLIIIICFITLLSTSCSKDYKEIPKSEFTETILPAEKIEKVVVENGEYLIIYTSEKIPYKIVSISNYEINPLVEKIQSNNKNVDISYEQRINISS